MRKLKALAALYIILSLTAFAEERTSVLTLNEAIRIALQNNPDIEASDASVEIMRAKVRSAKSVLYPQVEFRFIIPFVERESGIFADQLLWDFWRTPSLIKSSKAQLESTKFDRAATREDVILNTKAAYYTALSQKHLLSAAEKMYAEQEKRLEQAEGFFQTGRISKIELTKARVNLGNAKLNLITGRNNLEVAIMKLARVMGVKGDFNYELEYMLEYKTIELNLEKAIKNALETRPELKSLRAKEVGMRADITASRNKLYFPQVIGRAAYRFEGQGATGPDFIAGIGIRFPLFKGFSDLAGVSEAGARLRRLEAEMRLTEAAIESEIKELYMNLKFAEETIEVSQESKTSAEETFELAKDRYRLGRGSNVELAEAEALLAQTSANYFQSIYNYKIAAAQLVRAVGDRIEE